MSLGTSFLNWSLVELVITSSTTTLYTIYSLEKIPSIGDFIFKLSLRSKRWWSVLKQSFSIITKYSSELCTKLRGRNSIILKQYNDS